MGSADQTTSLVFTDSFQKSISQLKTKLISYWSRWFFFLSWKNKNKNYVILVKKIGRNKTHRFIVWSDELWYFLNTKIALTYCEKKLFSITRTIYLNSERSEQFLVTGCFFNLFLEVSHLNYYLSSAICPCFRLSVWVSFCKKNFLMVAYIKKCTS